MTSDSWLPSPSRAMPAAVPAANRRGIISLRDLATGSEVRRFGFGSDGRWEMPYECSPDGKLLASSGRDRTVLLWEFATGRLKGRFPHFAPPGLIIENLEIRSRSRPTATLSPSPKRSISLSIWDVESGRVYRRFHIGQSNTELWFAPDGMTFVSGGGPKAFRLLGYRRRKKIHRFHRLGNVVRRIWPRWQGAGNGQFSDLVQLWETTPAARSARMRAFRPHSLGRIIRPDRTVLASSGAEALCGSGTHKRPSRSGQFPACPGLSGQVAFAPDGKFFAAVDEHGAWALGFGDSQGDPPIFRRTKR